MARIGFIGLGHMGLPMAINLVKAGHEVIGFDIQAKAVEQLVLAGGLAAVTLSDAAKHQDILITMLQTGQQVQDVCLGDGGLYALADKLLHIDCSTIDIESSHLLQQHAEQHDLMLVDAPVSGGVKGAMAGTLTFMVGGDTDAFAKAEPILKTMGKKIHHAGPAGSGQAAKICNNMILGVSMIAISEAFVLAEQLKLAPDKLFDIVNSASGQCWAMSNYVPVSGLLPDVPANHDFQPGFTAAMMLKDLRLSQNAANTVGVDTPISAKATALYQAFNHEGFGQLDFSAIINQFKTLK